jgi:hypothetical protein
VIFLLSVYNLPLSVFLLFLWRWRSRFAAWVLLFLACRGAIEDENINTGFLGLLLVLVCVLWVSILCLSQFFLSFPASPSLCFAFLSPALRSPLLSLYRPSNSLGGGNSCPPP